MRVSTARFGLMVLAGCAAFPAVPASAAGASAGVPCVRTTLVARREPAGPAQYQAGQLRFANGASVRLTGGPGVLAEARTLRVGDPVAACYGPPRVYADAGPARTITVLDLHTGAYYGNLVGTWKAP